MEQNLIKRILVFGLVVSMIFNAVALYFVIKYQGEWSNNTSPTEKFDMLYLPFSSITREEFLSMQSDYSASYQGLKQVILDKYELELGGNYSVYFENLNTGAWVGIREKEKFFPGSLRKIPLMAAVLKKIDEGGLAMDSKIMITQEDVSGNLALGNLALAPLIGPLTAKGYNYEMSVEDLLYNMIYYSDNIAANALLRVVTPLKYTEAILAMGLLFSTLVENENNLQVYPISTKEYSNIFRSLYYSTYLRRRDSQYALDLLTRSVYEQGLPKGVPEGVKISHKVGFWLDGYNSHDCGIVYLPNNPYIICVMTKNTQSMEYAQNFAARVSKTVYDYVSSKRI